MRKTSLSIRKTRIGGILFWQVTIPKLGGGRERRTFRDRAEAQTYFDNSKIQQENFGTAALSISDALRVEAVECTQKLAEFGKTLRDATSHFIAHLRQTENSKPVAVVVADFIKEKKDEGKSARYTNDLRVRLKRFTDTFGEASIASISAKSISEWLDGLGVGIVTRNTFRRRLGALYAFAKQKEYLAENPFTGGKKAKIQRKDEPTKKVRRLSVEQAARLLERADERTLPFWAIAIFAGLRPESELCRLNWEEVDFQQKVIVVDGEQTETEETKTGRRVVEMSDNLIGWLKPYRKLTGPVMPFRSNKWTKLREDKRKVGFGTPGTETEAEKKAGVTLTKWTEDITRHTYGSNHLAKHGDIGKTATQMGNSPDMVRKHYLALVKPKDQKAFWNLRPAAKKGGKVIHITDVCAKAA